ncbi:uncharacterized protein LOC127845029 isoform X2 [Dreissena polymorpha]|uniref:uncharacterized protein LOC127845029 isoform X2 n=1 Tax=Dreissena polymorpha TaxID=45954 RepID=UPI002264C58B|nr:uncharacterized protein LOC127845029 isoform X2 [Dreissena polymorpha]
MRFYFTTLAGLQGSLPLCTLFADATQTTNDGWLGAAGDTMRYLIVEKTMTFDECKKECVSHEGADIAVQSEEALKIIRGHWTDGSLKFLWSINPMQSATCGFTRPVGGFNTVCPDHAFCLCQKKSEATQFPTRKPSAPATFQDFFRPPKFRTPDDSARLHQVQTDSKLVCAAKCLQMTGCRSFTLRRRERTCSLFDNDFSGSTDAVDALDMMYFVKHN